MSSNSTIFCEQAQICLFNSPNQANVTPTSIYILIERIPRQVLRNFSETPRKLRKWPRDAEQQLNTKVVSYNTLSWKLPHLITAFSLPYLENTEKTISMYKCPCPLHFYLNVSSALVETCSVSYHGALDIAAV